MNVVTKFPGAPLTTVVFIPHVRDTETEGFGKPPGGLCLPRERCRGVSKFRAKAVAVRGEQGVSRQEPHA